MSTTSTWQRYKGDGTLPPGAEIPKGAERGRYLADTELVTAVNTALAVEQPLLVTGQSGTGKTRLAWSIASELGLGNVLEFHTRSDHQAQDVLFSFDNLRRFYHATTNNPLPEDPRNYITYEPLGQAIKWTGDKPRLVLIDEIDQALRDLSDLEKQPATGELIVWVKVLHQAGVDPAALESIALSQVPFQGAVIKTRHDRQVVAKAS